MCSRAQEKRSPGVQLRSAAPPPLLPPLPLLLLLAISGKKTKQPKQSILSDTDTRINSSMG